MSIHTSTYVLVYSLVVAFLLGAVFGSFLNCVAVRIINKESIVKGRSHCMNCGHVLGVLDLVPLFSWIFLRGKCRYCKTKIPARYFLAELFMAVMTTLCVWRFDVSFLALRNFILLCCLFTLSMVDIDSMIIPNVFIIIPIGAWAAYIPLAEKPLIYLRDGLIAGAVYGVGLLLISLLMDRILKKESLGGGDIKLFFVMGLYLGLLNGLLALLAACVFGLIFVIIMKKRDQPFPFGPSISLSTWLVLLFGGYVTEWYLGLFA